MDETDPSEMEENKCYALDAYEKVDETDPSAGFEMAANKSYASDVYEIISETAVPRENIEMDEKAMH